MSPNEQPKADTVPARPRFRSTSPPPPTSTSSASAAVPLSVPDAPEVSDKPTFATNPEAYFASKPAVPPDDPSYFEDFYIGDMTEAELEYLQGAPLSSLNRLHILRRSQVSEWASNGRLTRGGGYYAKFRDDCPGGVQLWFHQTKLRFHTYDEALEELGIEKGGNPWKRKDDSGIEYHILTLELRWWRRPEVKKVDVLARNRFYTPAAYHLAPPGVVLRGSERDPEILNAWKVLAPANYTMALNMDRKVAFLAYKLGTDELVNSLLFYRNTRYILFMACMDLNKPDWDEKWKLLVQAIQERARACDADHLGSDVAHRACFEAWYSGALKISHMTKPVGEKLKEAFHKVTSPPFPDDEDVMTGKRCFMNLAFDAYADSDSRLALPVHDPRDFPKQRSGNAGLVEADAKEFEDMLERVCTDEGIRKLKEGLDELKLTDAVLRLTYFKSDIKGVYSMSDEAMTAAFGP